MYTHILRRAGGGCSGKPARADLGAAITVVRGRVPAKSGAVLMRNVRETARINVKAVLVLTVVVVLLGVGAVSVRYARKRVIASRAFAAGLAAFEREDWATACEQFKRYLSRRPTDQTENRHIEIPNKYAHALLRVRPLTADNIAAAIGAYRRVLRLDPGRRSTYDALATLYVDLHDFNELAYIARKLREQVPDDPKAAIWLATARIAQRELDEARGELETMIAQWEQRDGHDADYVLACVMLSGVAGQEGTVAASDEALAWLDRAVGRDPQSMTALLRRARFYRTMANSFGEQRHHYLSRARDDLERAAALQSTDPHERLLLVREWMNHGQLERAAAELDAVASLGDTLLKEAFLSLDEWRITRFLLKADLLLRKGAVSDGAALADEVLATLQHEQDHQRVLPVAVRLYALTGRIADARRSLAELRGLVATGAARVESEEPLALLEASIAHAEGRPYRVIEWLEPFVGRASTDSNVLRVLADAYLQTDQNRRAIKVLDRYFDGRGPRDDPEVALLLAREKMRAGDWAGAARLAETLAPDNAEAALLHVEARFRQAARRQPTQSIAALQALAAELARFREAAPDNVAVRVLQASVAVSLSQIDAAEQSLSDAIAVCPDSLPAELTLARLYVQSRRLDEALEVCRHACERHGDVASTWVALSEVQELLEDESEARQALRDGLAALEDPSAKRDIALRLAIFDLLHGARQVGIERLRALAAEVPGDVRTRSLLLDAPEILADADAAQQLIDDLRQIQGDSGLLWRVHQAALWLSADHWQTRQPEAQQLLEHCVDADPGWPAATLLLGGLHTRLGKLEEAEQVYRRALAANPSAANVADRLLALLQKQQRFADARQVLDQLQGNRGVRPERRIGVLLGAGDADRAIEELKLKVANDPKDGSARVALARLIYRETKNATLALQYLDEAEVVAGPSLVLTSVRVGVLQSEQRLDEARRLLDAAVEREESFDACFLRAVFLASIGDDQLAERDFVRLSTWQDRPDGHLLLGMFYAERERLDEAIAAWEQGLACFPDHAKLKRQLMTGLLARAQSNDRERGRQLLAELEEANPDDAELLWIRALLALNEGVPQAAASAERLLERVVELQPTAVDAHLQLVEIARRREDLAAARQSAVRALGANPNDPRILFARAEIERALGNTDMARTLVRLVLENDPQNVVALDLAVQLSLEGDTPAMLEEAQELLSRALEDRVNDPQLQLDLLLVLEARGESGRVDAALEGLRNSAEPRSAVPALLALSQLHWHRGELARGEQRLSEAATLAPDEPRVLRRRVTWLGELERNGELAALMGGDRPDPPHTADVLYAAGTFLASSDNPAHGQLALQLFEDVLAREPSQSPLWFDAVGRLYQAGAVDRAVQLYREVLAEKPESLRALNDLAWILAETLQAYEEALPLANRGLELAPNDVHLLDTRGFILSHLPGRLEDARRDFQKCAELQRPGTSGRAKALLQLARVTARLDDKLATRRCLREALAIDRRSAVFTAPEQHEISALRADVGIDPAQ